MILLRKFFTYYFSMAKSRSRSRGRSSTRKGQKRARYETPSNTPKKNKPMASRSTTRSRSQGPSGFRKNASREEANGIKNAEVRNSFKKSVSFTKKPVVKVTKSFKDKVEKSLEPKKITGIFEESAYKRITFPTIYFNKQILNRIGLDAATGDEMYFNPMRVLDAASVLFNDKIGSRSKYSFNGAGVYDTQTNSFNYQNTCVNVINSYAKATIKNNSKRTWIIQLYECSPKMDMDFTDVGDANTQWRNAMIQELDSPVGTLEKKINLNDATPETLYMTPNKCKAFMQKWNVEKHDVTIEPGQTYDHFMQGPQNVEYDFAKFYKLQASNVDRRFYDIQKKFTRCLIFTARLDIVTLKYTPLFGSPTYGAGRGGDGYDIGSSLNCEIKNYYKLSVPDKTGGTLSVPILGTTNFTNTQKRDCYFITNWDDLVSVGTTVTVEQRIEENTGEDNIEIDS